MQSFIRGALSCDLHIFPNFEKLKKMKLYYYKSLRGNFGDDLNPWILPKLMPGIFDGQCFHSSQTNPYNENVDSLFICIGTLLNSSVPKRPLKAVFGTGCGYGSLPNIDDKWNFYCVRGPLTAKALGLAPEKAITDAAALLRVLELPKVSKLKHKFSFMLHHNSHRYYKHILPRLFENIDINYIDPTADVETVIKSILGTEVIITEAMHGAIVADALRVPWIPVKTNDFILEFKWQDWCKSLGLDYQPILIPYSFQRISPRRCIISKGTNIAKEFLNTVVIKTLFIECLKNIMRNVSPTLSSDYAIEIATLRLLEKFEYLKADCAAGRYVRTHSFY